MRGALASELLKLRTTRTFFGLIVSVLLLVVAISVLGALLGEWDSGVAPGEDVVGIAAFAVLFGLIFGVLAVSTEFRHGTITPTLLAVPSRTRLIAAKVAAYLLGGLLLGVASVAVSLALVEPIVSSRGFDSGTTGSDVLSWMLGTGLGAALFAALGVGIGAIVRNQVGALIGVFAWMLVVEPLLTIAPVLEDPIAKFGLGGLADGVDGFDVGGSGDVLGQLPAGLVLAGYVVLVGLAAAATLRRRDVT